MKKILEYVDQHHEEFGVALFVIPVLFGAFVLVGVVCLVARLFE